MLSLHLPGPLVELMQNHLRHSLTSGQIRCPGGLCTLASRRTRLNEVLRRHAHALALKALPEGNEFEVGQWESESHALEKGPAWLPSDTGVTKRNPATLFREQVENFIARPILENAPVDEPEPTYTEDDLQNFYANLLAHPQSSDQLTIDAPSTEDKINLVQDVALRILVKIDHFGSTFQDSTNNLSTRLSARLSSDRTDDVVPDLELPLDPSKLWHTVLARLTDIVQSLERAPKLVADQSHAVPITLLSQREWDALIGLFLEENSMILAEHALSLIKRSGSNLPEKLSNKVLNYYATQGNVTAVEEFLKRFSEGSPTERQRDLHIKAHLRSSLPDYNVETALATLHSYESLALLPPIPSYTRLITALFSVRSTQAHAQAWDLFAHMRYVAHPKPDPLLYSLMIRACAGTGASQSGYLAEPERALDLWTEMRSDAKFVPTVGAYNAIILVCARSKDFVADAFRLAKEMLDSYRDAFGNPLMKPTQETFCALLVAAKTRGDLPRARWILAEMLKFQQQEDATGNVIDEEAMIHVLHAYASYRPPFRRHETKIVEGSSKDYAALSSETDIAKEAPSRARFGVTPPQTRREVILEARTLFERIIEDSTHERSAEEHEASSKGSFSRVSLTPRLLNSYLSVHYRHGPLNDARALFNDIFARLNVKKTPRSVVEALERCATAEGDEREVARLFTDELWGEWRAMENTLAARGIDARLIERAHAAVLRVYVLSGELDRAMSHVRAFAQRYPPFSVSEVTPKPVMRSTRTVLFAPRPLVRTVSHTDVQDDTVTPVMTFRDLELLHHRLVGVGHLRRNDLAFIKYICKAYEGALRKRRDRTIKS